MEAVIANDVYNTTGYNTKQDKTISQMSTGYTSIVWDMIDTVNQGFNRPAYPDDQVSGYNLFQIEFSLPGNLGNWWTWRENIKRNFSNPKEEHLDKLFQDLK